MPVNVTATLRRALHQLESERTRIDQRISVLKTALGSANRGGAPRRRRSPMSAATRAAVSKRMKAYWAKRRAAKKA